MKLRTNNDIRLCGRVGLIAAIISQAIWDAQNGQADHARDAWRYFCGDGYRHHIEILGVHGFMLPRELKQWQE